MNIPGDQFSQRALEKFEVEVRALARRLTEPAPYMKNCEKEASAVDCERQHLLAIIDHAVPRESWPCGQNPTKLVDAFQTAVQRHEVALRSNVRRNTSVTPGSFEVSKRRSQILQLLRNKDPTKA